MTPRAKIAAQLAAQRSTQYSSLARVLAPAELLASPLGLGDVTLRRLGEQEYLEFAVGNSSLSARDTELLGSLAMIGNVFELFDAVGQVEGPLLRPLATTHRPFLSPDMASIRRYKGKTSEFFTHFLCNMAKFASDFRDERWSALHLLDPLAGGGTTLFVGLSLGAHVAGIELNRTDVESTVTFISQFCREGRLAVTTKEERLRKLDARRWHFQIGRDEARQCLLVQGDAGRANELLAGFGRPHLIVTDLPYGIQHNARLEGLLAGCLPEWCRTLRAGGAIAFSWDATRLTRERMVELVSRLAPVEVVDRPPYDNLVHRVDRVIKRRDVLVLRHARAGSP
jgi:hypothetical protein